MTRHILCRVCGDILRLQGETNPLTASALHTIHAHPDSDTITEFVDLDKAAALLEPETS